MTNIKNSFELNFKKTRWMGHLHYVQDDCDYFVHSGFRNEIFWCGECVHIPIVG
jgi:hypothetical protein